MKKSRLILLTTTLVMLFSLIAAPKAVQAAKYPTFTISAVETDKNVTIYTYDVPANKQFKVLMGENGTKGIGGIEVATINSGAGGSFYGTFDIPEALKGRAIISIRMQGVDNPFYAYNWFYNKTGGTTPPEPPEKYKGFPTFSILAVEEDETVTIKTNNFPKETEFDVLMGKMWTMGVKGIFVKSIDSGEGGVFEATFDIPEDLKGLERISIRLQSDEGYYAYNWFWNNSADEPVTPPPGYVGIPTFSIVAVDEDESVTIKTKDFPKDMEFDVLMGKMWTMGIKGILVTTINSGDGGVFEATYEIPESLQGQERIAIRLQSDTGYYAYNWFWNNTYP